MPDSNNCPNADLSFLIWGSESESFSNVRYFTMKSMTFRIFIMNKIKYSIILFDTPL
jgi:hypothetical protein